MLNIRYNKKCENNGEQTNSRVVARAGTGRIATNIVKETVKKKTNVEQNRTHQRNQRKETKGKEKPYTSPLITHRILAGCVYLFLCVYIDIHSVNWKRKQTNTFPPPHNTIQRHQRSANELFHFTFANSANSQKKRRNWQKKRVSRERERERDGPCERARTPTENNAVHTIRTLPSLDGLFDSTYFTPRIRTGPNRESFEFKFDCGFVLTVRRACVHVSSFGNLRLDHRLCIRKS